MSQRACQSSLLCGVCSSLYNIRRQYCTSSVPINTQFIFWLCIRLTLTYNKYENKKETMCFVFVGEGKIALAVRQKQKHSHDVGN